VKKKSQRWATIVVLGFITLIFLGMSMFPLIGAIFNQQKQTTINPDANTAKLLQDEDRYQRDLERAPNDQNGLQRLLNTRIELIRLGLRKSKDLIDPLERLIRLNPNNPQLLIALAKSQADSGNSAAAAAAYRTVLDRQPANTESLQGYVTILLKQNQSAQAFDVLQKSIATAKQINQQQPNSADLPAIELMLGDVYLAQQKSAEAIALYDRLQKENPTDFRPVAAKGLALRNQGKNTEALALFKSAQALAPDRFKDKIQQLIAATQNAVTAPASPISPSPKSSTP
jgi:tetratricopeptide (TPR) repeat protein